MRKTLQLLLTLVLFVCNVSLFANNNDDDNSAQITIGNGTAVDISPFITKYSYSWDETIYTGTEIGGACVINAISYHSNVEDTPYPITLSEIDIYMATTDKLSFDSQIDWIPSYQLNHVYSGNDVVIGDSEWEKFTLDIPYYFNGNGNLVIIVAKKTLGYNSSLKWYYTEDPYTSTMFYGNDGNENIADYPPTTSDLGTRTTYRANVMLDVEFGEVSSPLVITPNPIDLGLRPAGAWMSPVAVEMSTESTPASVLSVESSNKLFVVSTFDEPALVTSENPFTIKIKHAESNVIGDVNGQITIKDNYGVNVVDIKAKTYAPVSPDVWEKAAVVTSYPFSDTPDFDNLYDNYNLPGEEQDGPDAVYQLTVEEETVLSVAANGTNAKFALYPSNFNGKGGPDVDNYYGAPIDPDQPFEPEFPEIEIPELQGNSFSYNFDDGSLEDWRTIDADGDRYNWSVTTDGNINTGYEICIYSLSYIPGADGSAVEVDNYIVTKGSYAIDANSKLEFDVRAFDPSYPNETYGVVISTDGVEFETIGIERLENAAWNHKTISLAEYAGKNVVIGFRHYDSKNEYALLIDNVVLTPGRGAKFNKTEKYTVPAGTYYLAVSATERFSVNVNAATVGGFNPVTEVRAEKLSDDNVNVCWSWDFIENELRLSNGKSLNRNRDENTEATVLGYNVYRRNTTTDETILLQEKTTDTTYVDNTWETATMGICQWGVAVIYDDNGAEHITNITWSNGIGKDMFTSLKLNVTTENELSPAGTIVSFANVYEPSYKYEVTLDETGTYEWESFRRGTYRYSISLEGHKPYATNALIEIWDETELNCELEELFVLGDLYVSPTGWAMWNDDADSYQVKLDGEIVTETTESYYQFDVTNLIVGQEYSTTLIGEKELEYTWTYVPCDNFVQPTELEFDVDGKNVNVSWVLPVQGFDEAASQFMFDFEDESLNGWITIDANGDGYTWSNSAKYSQTECGYQSWYSAMSYSCVGVTPLTPDDYMVTSKKYNITETSKLRFNVSAESSMFSQEHYGIAISTNSNFSVEDFKMIYDETLPKEENSNIHGEWYTRTVDLSEYAGQSVYIAFRHYNCTDQFWINIDNVELTTEETRKKDGEWLYYDNGENYDALGLQGGASFYWGIMFPAKDIAKFAGQSLTKISTFDFTEHSGNFMIYLGGDDAPGTLVHSQEYQCTGVKDFIEFELTSPVDISGEQNVWIIFNNNQSQYVASCSVGLVEPNGRWFSLNGTEWTDVLYSTGLNLTWQIRAYVEEVPIPNSTDLEVLGAMLFRDGELLTEAPITEEEFNEVLPYGDYEYSLRVVYGGEETSYYAMSCPLSQTLNHEKICQAPKNLYGETVINEDGSFGTSLEWPYTLHGSKWLGYDNGVHSSGIGIVGTPIYWGIMFPSEELEFYDGTYITKVTMFDREAHDGNIMIYYGGDKAPEMLIHTQPYSCYGGQSFIEFDLTTPIPVDASTNLWVVMNNKNGNYPASFCSDTGNKNGRWLSTDGENWADIATLPDMACTWLLRAYVTSDAKSAPKAMEPIELVNNANANVSFNDVMKDSNRNEDVFAHYNVYRGTSMDNLELIAQPTEGEYFDEVEKGTYYYQVTATYFEGEIECESAPANSYVEPENNYVVVEVTSINENGVKAVMAYPNPTSGMLNVTAENMTRVTIINALGQVLYDVNVNGDNQIIDMSKYNTGIYMLRIATENGVAVERISVVK